MSIAGQIASQIAHLLILTCSLCTTNAARILGIFPFEARSHFNYNHAIMKSLHAAGHQITMVTTFIPSEKRMENFTYVDFHPDEPVLVSQFAIEYFANMTFAQNMNWVIPKCVSYCYYVMKLPQIQMALKTSKKLYDVLFVELLVGHSCYLPIAEKLQIPVIGTMTMSVWQLSDHAVGAPNNPTVLPVLFGNYVSPTSLIERVDNLLNYLALEYYRWKIDVQIDKFYHDHYSNDDLLRKKEVSLAFYNSHPSILSRPLPPNVIEIGGIHVDSETKSLSKKLQTFIEESSHGVILFSLGSMLRMSSITREQRDSFLNAFAVIPQRVIWKFEEANENLPKNVMILDWLPQKDILKHKNVIAFMSHCGQSGMYEAIATGTPVVTIPIGFDQYMNAATLHRLGVGVDLQLKTVTKDTVLIALDTIINDTSYYQRSQELSRVFMDRPFTPEESVVYWTEYVLKHKGASHLKALGSDMPLYKYFMLDIVVLAVAALSLVVLAIYVIAKKIFYSVANVAKISTKKCN